MTSIEQLQYQIRLLNKKIRCSAEVKYATSELTGPAGCYKIAVDNSTGNIYYKNSDGDWQPIPSSGGGLESIVAGDNISIDDTDPLNPIISSTGGGNSLLKVVSADFTNATDYDNASLITGDLAIFLNIASRYLEDDEWEHTATGIRILVPDFDTTSINYTLYITKL